MWLLPVVRFIADTICRIFYRLDRAGGTVPENGPVLLVANHNNSLIDPAMVITAADRPVRFLAKAPLFEDPTISWLVRAGGAIPVYRRQDDPALMERNAETFEAAHRALADGHAVGIFPEGMSHGEPSLSPLKTGAARIALGGSKMLGRSFPIIPVGLVFRQKESFRSDALIVVGPAIEWSDLAGRTDDRDAAQTLTSRIEAGLRRVTVNVETWEDAPLVECAEAVWAAEREGSPEPAARLERLRTVTDALSRLRHSGDPTWQPLAADIARHARLLERLRMKPSELHVEADITTAARWSIRQLPFVSVIAGVIAAAGALLWWVPYRLTGVIARVTSPKPDTISTYKALYGSAAFLIWWILLIVAGGLLGGWWVALMVLVAAPAMGLAVLALHERWRDAFGDARRFFLRRRRRDLILGLRERQRALADRLDELRSRATGAELPGPAGPHREAGAARGSGSGSSATT